MCLIPRLILPAVLLSAAFTPTAQALVQSRIPDGVADSSRVALSHTVPPRALSASDLGPAPAGQKLDSLSLRFNMTDAQKADLTQLLIDQQNPSSPLFHKWLTPEQFGVRFGLSSSDLAKVSTWLTGQGFTITGVARSSNFISFTGTVAQAQQSFGTSIHALSRNGEQNFSNVTDPVLPSAIAGVVADIAGLNDFKLQPHSRANTVQLDPVQPLNPRYTQTVGGTVHHFIAPGDFNTIYHVNQLISGGTDGSGVTIAVMGQTDINLADIAAFRSASGLAAKAPVLKLYGTDPGTKTGDIGEASLDVEWSGAVAPNATILYVYSTNVMSGSLANAITNNLAPIITISYGLCESGWGSSTLNSFSQILQQANAQGTTVISASGDSGAADCDVAGLATEGLAVDFPGSSPFVTAMGGTMFNEGAGTYWNTTNTTNSGSAITYIPELPWNESNATAGLDAGGAGGGGTSAFFAKPAWQTGPGVPTDSSRDVPDISLNAAAIHDGYLVCTQGSCTNGFLNSAGSATVFGGTSFGAPTFAGLLALVEQKLGGTPGVGIGNINPVLYGLGSSTYANAVFHDIVSGNNSIQCVQGTPNCQSGGTIGFIAGNGYDQASGWGTVDAFNLANSWKLATPTGGGSIIGTRLSSTALTTTSALCGVSTAGLALSVTVANASTTTGGAPTGNVQFYVDSTAVGSPVPLSNGAAAYTLSTATLSSGGHNVSAVYSGDGTYSGSKGSLLAADGTIALIDVVSATQPDFSMNPCTGTTSALAGAVAPAITFTITPVNGFNGSVTLTASSNSNFLPDYTFSVSPVPVSGTTGATTSFVLKAYKTNAKSATAQLRHPGNHQPSGRAPWYAAGSGATLACMLLLTLPRRRRWGALLAAVLSIAAFGAAGCGGSTTAPPASTTPTTTTTPAAAGTYGITVMAVSGSVVHSSVVTFTVH